MTKADLIDEVSKIANLTKKETETIVNTVFDNITDALSKGDKVELRSEEHTSELQSRGHLVCRLLLEKKKSLGRLASSLTEPSCRIANVTGKAQAVSAR